MRPSTLEWHISEPSVSSGQTAVTGDQNDQIHSMVLSGRRGASVGDDLWYKATRVERARRNRDDVGRRAILFVEEVHCFSKASRTPLPHIEEGTITLYRRYR
ncbi:MAG: Replication-associated recombination protein A [Sodalis sp.]|nr:MAG: Replication-associated recombination protein A [Sodalis sp.]